MKVKNKVFYSGQKTLNIEIATACFLAFNVHKNCETAITKKFY